jgi:hypothetical protein
MADEQHKPHESDAEADRQRETGDAPRDSRRWGRVLTAKDAGWVSPTTFVLPLTFVPIDPPRPLPKRRRRP